MKEPVQQHEPSRTINVASPAVANQQSAPVDEPHLTDAERKALRRQRFVMNAAENFSTMEAKEKVEEMKAKKKERAERFGIPLQQSRKEKLEQRKVKFGGGGVRQLSN